MGQQLIGRPISQRSGFSTLMGNSSGQAPDLSQYLGFMTPPQQQQQMSNPQFRLLNQPPSTIGFRGFGGMPRFGGGSVGLMPRQQSG